MRPMNRRHADSSPISKIVAEAIGVAAFASVVHLFKDRQIEFSQHSFPVSILICAWKETIGKFHQSIEYGDIETDNFFEVRSLYFYCHFAAVMQPRAINLAQRSGGDWLGVNLSVGFQHASAQRRFNSFVSFGRRECRNLVLQDHELFDVRKRQQITASTTCLTYLYEGWSQANQILT